MPLINISDKQYECLYMIAQKEGKDIETVLKELLSQYEPIKQKLSVYDQSNNFTNYVRLQSECNNAFAIEPKCKFAYELSHLSLAIEEEFKKIKVALSGSVEEWEQFSELHTT